MKISQSPKQDIVELPINKLNNDDQQPQTESKSTTEEQSSVLSRSSEFRKQTKFIQPKLSGKIHAYTAMSDPSNFYAFVALSLIHI